MWRAESNLLPTKSSIHFFWESLFLPLEEKVIMQHGTLDIILLIREYVQIYIWYGKGRITQETDPISKEIWLLQSASHPNKIFFLLLFQVINKAKNEKLLGFFPLSLCFSITSLVSSHHRNFKEQDVKTVLIPTIQLKRFTVPKTGIVAAPILHT